VNRDGMPVYQKALTASIFYAVISDALTWLSLNLK